MIKLFVADLDGCVSMPFESPNWEAFTEIRKLNQRSAGEEHIPALTLCSGRPQPYVEALGQMLDVRFPFIFESGGGLYHAQTNELIWSDQFNDERREKIEQIKKWVDSEIISEYSGTIPEFAKQTDVGLINPDKSKIEEMYQQITEFVEAHFDEFETHHTDVSINVIMRDSNKGVALDQLSRLTGISVSEMAYIGDGTNDIPALKRVGLAYAPMNARKETKEHAEVIELQSTRAVLEAYRQLAQISQTKYV